MDVGMIFSVLVSLVSGVFVYLIKELSEIKREVKETRQFLAQNKERLYGLAVFVKDNEDIPPKTRTQILNIVNIKE